MRRSIFIALAVTVGFFLEPVSAGEILPGAPNAAVADALIAKERSTWTLYKNKDEAALTKLSADDFADLYSDGVVVDRKHWLDDMKEIDVDRFALSKFHAFRLADDAILLTYEGEAWGRARNGKPLYNHAAVTSVWAQRQGQWLNVFYGESVLDSRSYAPERQKP